MVSKEGEGPSPELRFLKECFREYYRENRIEPPYRFARREWGFFPFGGKMMYRHAAFSRREELFRFFPRQVPMHAYHSVAYYKEPDLQPMGDKFRTWMGADLVFDLDADHLPDADRMSYEKQLSSVKSEVKRLLFDFLLDDLGFPEDGTQLNFSGGRGYHIHVRNPSVLSLGSRERRAIVDYITGRGIDFDVLFPEVTTDVNVHFGSAKTRRDFRSRTYGGWVTRIYRAKNEILKKMMEMDDDKERAKFLLEISGDNKLGIKDKKCHTIVEDLFSKGGGESAKRMIREDRFALSSRKRIDIDLLKLVKAYASVKLSGETDEPVTTDIKRLIRVQGSLHGKTGFKVVPVELDSLDDFDPLVDAVVLPSHGKDILVHGKKEIEIGGEKHHLSEGQQTVPRYLAYFLVARREAILPRSHPEH